MKPSIDIFRPNKYSLDTEWEDQPKLYYTYAEKLADAEKAMDLAKAERDFVEADLDKLIRENPQKFDLDGVTEPAIQRTIKLRKRYKQANNKYIEAKYQVAQMKAVVDALEHRKKALEALMYLEGRNYFSEPRPIKGTTRTGSDVKIDRVLGKKR